MITYKMNLSFDLGNAVDKIGDIRDDLNAELAKFGIDEKFNFRTKALSINCESNRKLKKEEKALIAREITHGLNGHFPGWGFRVVSFRCKSQRKSCNQSAVSRRSQSR